MLMFAKGLCSKQSAAEHTVKHYHTDASMQHVTLLKLCKPEPQHFEIITACLVIRK